MRFSYFKPWVASSYRLARSRASGPRRLSTAISLSGHIAVVQQTISPVGLTQPVLAQALTAVRNVADDIGVLLAGMYGGRTPLAAVETCEPEDAA